MNPQYLPPQQSNYGPQPTSFPPRINSANAPLTTTSKNGPTTIGSPSPNLTIQNTTNGVPLSRDSITPPSSAPVLAGYAPSGMPQKNSQMFMPGNGPNQTYLGNSAEPINNNHTVLPTPGQNLGGPAQMPGAGLSSQYLPNMGPTQQVLNQSSLPPSQNPNASSPPGGMPPKTSPMSHMQSSHGAVPPMQQQNPLSMMPPLPGGMPPKQGQMPTTMPGQPNQNPSMPPYIGGAPPKQPSYVPTSTQQGPMSSMPPQGQMPPMPGRMPPMLAQGQLYQSNQLTNQMQGMSLGGPRQGPHMPPPLNPPGYMQQPSQPMPPMQQGMPPMQQGSQGSGYPPMVQPTGYAQSPPPQKQSLNPDQMPSQIQVVRDDQENRGGVFVTNQKGLVPPLVTTNFTVQDQGNTSPRFIRSTMYNVPVTQDIMKQTAVPFSLVLSPMARLGKDEYPPPIVNFGELGPVRCIRCKAYMCPYMQFIDSGRRFQCLFCKATTDVPAEYFQHLDHTGQRMDKYERPELVLGTYEFVATSDYCRNNTLPKPPAMIFVIDVSYNSIKSGLVHLLCSRMKEIIQNLPIDQGHEKSNMKVGFITYNSSVHFYNIKGTLAAPQMMVVGDTQEMFMPLLDGFLCTPEESEMVIESLMEQIPTTFAETKETEIILLPAVLAGLEALKASETTGKLLVFHSTLPIAEAPGKLKNRDDRKLLGTDKEKTILSPQTQAYNQLGQDCVAAGCSVDLFVFNNSFIDLATISQVSRLTGGEVFKYTYFQADIDGERLINDVIMDVSRPIAFDSIMRVRTSTGVRPTDFYGYFFMSNTTDMELAALDCDKGVGIEIKHDDKLSEEEGVYIQAALLYTSCSGQRRLRIMNLSFNTCSQMADLYRSCDLDTIMNYLAKQATFKLLDNSPKAIKDALVNRAAQILATYRKNCATPSSAGQLILPESMKLLPLYLNCVLKSDAISGGSEMTIDDRAFAMQAVLTMDVFTSVSHFYPRLIPIHQLDVSGEQVEVPEPIRCTIDKMNDQGVYILENGIHMFLWVGLGAAPDFVQNVFGVPSAIQIDIEKPYLPELDNPLSIAVRNIIDEIRIQRHRCMRLTMIRQREKLEPVFKHFLVEDRGTDGSPSYVDFLCHMHREIRNLLS